MIAVLKSGVTKTQRDNLVHWLESQNVEYIYPRAKYRQCLASLATQARLT